MQFSPITQQLSIQSQIPAIFTTVWQALAAYHHTSGACELKRARGWSTFEIRRYGPQKSQILKYITIIKPRKHLSWSLPTDFPGALPRLHASSSFFTNHVPHRAVQLSVWWTCQPYTRTWDLSACWQHTKGCKLAFYLTTHSYSHKT
jgi:hypothetical protein